MYNDEKNLYHYNYRKDGTEQPQSAQPPVVGTTYREPWEEPKKEGDRSGFELRPAGRCCRCRRHVGSRQRRKYR